MTKYREAGVVLLSMTVLLLVALVDVVWEGVIAPDILRHDSLLATILCIGGSVVVVLGNFIIIGWVSDRSIKR